MTEQPTDEEIIEIRNPSPTELAEGEAGVEREIRSSLKFMLFCVVVVVLMGLVGVFYYL